jgi:fructose 1,6-bisphosphate aldolase/phosphatase
MPTLSIIKADTGGFVGYTAVHPDMVAVASRAIDRARGEFLIDGQVAACRDDLASHS